MPYPAIQTLTPALPLDADLLNPAVLESAHRWAAKAVQLDPNLAAIPRSVGVCALLQGNAGGRGGGLFRLDPDWTGSERFRNSTTFWRL
jgi:hypothetical protein